MAEGFAVRGSRQRSRHDGQEVAEARPSELSCDGAVLGHVIPCATDHVDVPLVHGVFSAAPLLAAQQ
eukprot:4637104-Prymnesium_polylepis.1